ncbi:50S ribosomal protein L22 [Candidatus Dependentiae bacterium]|nr:50S ribosomal protein L22 [Candidatus Dependentiae bacterium]
MNFKASAKYVKRSPFKLRPIADVIRGKNAAYALDWLKVYGVAKSLPIKKLLDSAIANAKNLQGEISVSNLVISEIRIDQGPVYRYFKPSAMGRSLVNRKRLSHLTIVLKHVEIEN